MVVNMNNTDSKVTQTIPISPQVNIYPSVPYISNPFSLVFDALQRAFRLNQVSALIVLLAVPIISTVGNVFTGKVDTMANSNYSFDFGQIKNALLPAIAVIVFQTLAQFAVQIIGVNAAMKTVNGVSIPNSDIMGGVGKYAYKFVQLGLVYIGFYTLLFMPVATMIFWAFNTTKTYRSVVIVASVLVLLISTTIGILFSLLHTLSMYAIVDKELPVLAAMSRSRQLTKGRLLEVNSIMFAAGIVPIVSGVLSVFGLGQYYAQLSSYIDSGTQLPPVHPLKWLPIGLIAAFGLFIIVIAAAIIYSTR
jgi:hypothetical protein